MKLKNKLVLYRKRLFNAHNIAIMGLLVGMITLGRFLDDFMPQVGGYTALNLWWMFAIITAIILPFELSFFTFVSSFLIWIALGKAGMQYGPFSVMFDFFIPFAICAILSFSKKIWTLLPLIIIATFLRHLSHTVSGNYVWAVPMRESFIFNAPWPWISTAFSIPFIIILYPQLVKLKYVKKSKERW